VHWVFQELQWRGNKVLVHRWTIKYKHYFEIKIFSETTFNDVNFSNQKEGVSENTLKTLEKVKIQHIC
jgi:hypothetical protein